MKEEGPLILNPLLLAYPVLVEEEQQEVFMVREEIDPNPLPLVLYVREFDLLEARVNKQTLVEHRY